MGKPVETGVRETENRLTLKQLSAGQFFTSTEYVVEFDEMLSFASKFDPQLVQAGNQNAKLLV